MVKAAIMLVQKLNWKLNKKKKAHQEVSRPSEELHTQPQGDRKEPSQLRLYGRRAAWEALPCWP